MIRLVDVARKAGVSVSVVSRVLSEDANLRVRSDTRAAVLKAAGDLGYKPNHAGRALRLNYAGAIGLFVPLVNNAIFADVLEGVKAGLAEADLLVLLGDSDGLDRPHNYASRIREEGRIDGLIIQPRDDATSATATPSFPKGTPAVLINSHEIGPLTSVAHEDALAAWTATEFLVRCGHKAIGLIGGLPQTGTARERERGYRAALDAARLKTRRSWVTHLGYQPNDGRDAMRKMLSLSDPPTAVVVANANAAIGALFAAREAKVEVPAQLSVVAIHDIWHADHTWPALTTVQLPNYELGLQGANALLRVMKGGPIEHIIVRSPTPKVLERASHGPPARLYSWPGT